MAVPAVGCVSCTVSAEMPYELLIDAYVLVSW